MAKITSVEEWIKKPSVSRVTVGDGKPPFTLDVGAKKFGFAQRVRTHRRAKKLLGIESDAGDRYTFMLQCVNELVDEGSDPMEAYGICEVLYEEGLDFGEGDY